MKLHKNLNIGSIFFFMELDSYISFYKGISVFLTCMYENHHCNVFFFCLWMFTVHVICFAIEQYKNKQTREASLVMYKLLNKKKKFIHDCTELLFYKSLFYEMFVRVFCHVQYLLLRKKTGTKNNFFFYYKWSLACDITQLLTIKWKILFPRKKKLPLECLCTGCICHLFYALCVKGKTQNLSCL